TAKDKATGKSQNIRIEASSGLSDDEIKRMKAEAEANAEADRKTKEEADKVNQADSLIFQTEKQLTEYGEKLSAPNKENIQKALSELKEAHKEKDLAKIETSMNALNTAWQAASEEMYKAAQASGPENAQAGNANESKSGDTEVTDVDFEEVKENKS
ncbi:MAG: hypothetical protein RIQ89_386, partial [Bacteroidota bacterium]